MILQKNALKSSLAALAAITVIMGSNASAQPQGHGQSNRPLVKDLGRVAAGEQQSISVYLKLHDQAGFDQAVKDLYDPASANFHRWFTDADFAKYAPTAAEMQSVRSELEQRGLKTVSVDPLNYSLRVRGSSSAIETAFQTELHAYSYRTSSFQGLARPAKLAGSAGDLVAATVGLERHHTHPQLTIAKDPLTGKPLAEQPLAIALGSNGIFGNVTNTALTAPTQYTLKPLWLPLPLPNPCPADDPSFCTFGVFNGPAYGINFIQFVTYTPQDLQSHYGLTSLIGQGNDGRGQTIALVEGFGYANAVADANAAASAFGLPPLTADNFKVVYPEGPPLDPNAAELLGWNFEIALDIQAAHAIAPGAKIIEVASAGQDNEDQIASLEYILRHRLANIVSCSWENDPEIISGRDEELAFNSVLQRMAAAGISVQFASGDSGDLGLGSPLGAVSVPSNSPYATSVGGTTIMNDPLGSGDIVTGWGSNLAMLEDTLQVFNPPLNFGFLGGAGGGESLFYAKPSWQSSLPGTGRQVPDVSALADPLTGFTIVVTDGGVQQGVAGIGGTSLAAPIFSAIWSLAQQYNRETLGFAAPAVARLKPGQITDVLDTSDLTSQSLSGTITDLTGSQFFSASDIFSSNIPALTQPNYLTAITPFHCLHCAFAIAFGADTSLTVGPGWDNVTGFGQPNGLPFIQAVGSQKGHGKH
jgi:subtilase family serine protease